MFQKRVFCLLLACGLIAVEGATTPAPKATTPAPTSPAAAAKAAGTTPAGTKAAGTTPAGTTPAGRTTAAVATDLGVPPPGAPDASSCSDKKPCPDKNGKCIDGHCFCNDGYTFGENDTCIKLPNLGEPCKVGKLEFSCQGDGVEVNCPTNGTVCECKLGYEPDKKNSCKAASRLVGAACKVDGDCTAAFATCQSKKCACEDGFKTDAKTSLCTPTNYNCLNGDKALKEKGAVRRCEMTVDIATGEVGNDTCPSTHFCATWQNTQTKTRGATGHCCPKPKSAKNNTVTCAVGVAHKTGKCLDLSAFPADAPLPDKLGPFCASFDGYECTPGQVCCPLACRSSSSHFNVDGKCYDHAIIGQPCELDTQCLPGSACTKGTCKCKKGYTEVSSTYCLAPGEQNPFAIIGTNATAA